MYWGYVCQPHFKVDFQLLWLIAAALEAPKTVRGLASRKGQLYGDAQVFICRAPYEPMLDVTGEHIDYHAVAVTDSTLQGTVRGSWLSSNQW